MKSIIKFIAIILIIPFTLFIAPLAIIVIDIAVSEWWSDAIPVIARIIITTICLPIILLGFILILIYDEIFINR